MTPATATPDAARQARSPDHGAAGRARSSTILATAIGAVVVGAVRAWAARGVGTIGIIADEPGYLGAARLLGGGGPAWNLANTAAYSSGYGVVQAPWFALTDSPATIYQLVIATNVVLGMAGMVALVGVTRRATRLGPVAAAAAATAASIAPATATHVRWAWAENLAPLAVAGVLLVAWRLAERPTTGRVAAAVAVAVAVTAVHGRFLALAAVVAGLLVVLIARHRDARTRLGTGVGALAAGVVAVRIAERVISTRLHGGEAPDSRVTGRLDRITELKGLVIEVVGQSWAVLATTAGLAAMGALALVRAWRRLGTRAKDPVVALDRTGTGILAAAVAASAVVSVGFLSIAYRADHLVYGRYLDPVIMPVVLVGIAALVGEADRRLLTDSLVVLGGLAITATALWAVRQTELTTWPLVAATIPGLIPLADLDAGVTVPRASVLASGVLVVLVGSTLFTRWLSGRARPGGRHLARMIVPLTIITTLAAVGSAIAVVDLEPNLDRRSPQRLEDFAEAEALVPEGAPIRYRVNGKTPLFFFEYSFAFPGHRLVRELADEPVPAVESPWLVARTDDPAVTRSGARLAFIDPDTINALWVTPGPVQDRLAAEGRLLPADFPAAFGPRNRRADLTATAPVRLDDGQLTGTIIVSRPPGGAIWPVTRGAQPVEGMVTLGVAIRGRDCACVLADERAPLPGVVAPGERTRVHLAVDLDDLPAGTHDVEIQLLQEGEARFGPTVEATITVGPSTGSDS